MNIRYPAEWEPQAAVWLSFPHHKLNWAGARGEKIRRFYFELISILLRFQEVKILIPPGFEIPENFSGMDTHTPFKLNFIPIATDDIWIRDYGPLFVKNGGKTELAEFQFNAWGEKFPPWENDNLVPSKMANLEQRPLKSVPYIFEGGAIEINDDGLGISTLDCIIGKNRNKKEDLARIRKAICTALGLRDLIILPQGLHGDHTDGHIDNVARFVSTTQIVIAAEADPESPNHAILKENAYLLKTWLRRHYENRAQVDTIALPPQNKLESEVLPASYMNFIFANGALIFPLYHSDFDGAAREYFTRVFPDREVIGIDCTTVIEEGGSLHCMSKQEPA
ncbi:MAG: agmatine deiminase family protein [Fibrobacter sp.]|jgi:agmatine deiminase|nr:agmatine deiminase family protein [Fibrobacter sp.]